MHERTRRNLCRLAFLAFGVLPTVCTLVWSGYRTSPLYAASERAAWEHRLSELTGLMARIARVEHPAGGSTLLHTLEFTDPDGGDRVAIIRQAEIAYQPQGVVVLLSQPEVAQGKFLRLWDVLHNRVLQGQTPTTAIQITSSELTLEVGRQAQTFTTVRCTVEPFETSVLTWIEFQLAGVEMPGPAQLRIERNRQISPPTTAWMLHTDTPLPCAIFTDYLRPLARLGDRALFQGTVSCTSRRDHWSGELTGHFSQVDLDQLTESLPHKLSGFATITLDRAVVEQGVLSSATGSVVSPGGTVSRSLVAALAQNMALTTPEVTLADNTPLTVYDRLAFRFSVSGEGFSIAGLDPSSDDVILTRAGQPLLTGDQRARYPLVALVRALTPDSQFLVPATDATKELLQWLDFPSPHPRTISAAEPPPPRVQLSKRKRE